MFYSAYLQGRGDGCDYTMACNQKLVGLPTTIKSIEEAKQWVLNYYENQIVRDCDGQTIAEITLYEHAERPVSVDLEAFKAEYHANKKRQEEAEQRTAKEAHDIAEYERLKKKFG